MISHVSLLTAIELIIAVVVIVAYIIDEHLHGNNKQR